MQQQIPGDDHRIADAFLLADQITRHRIARGSVEPMHVAPQIGDHHAPPIDRRRRQLALFQRSSRAIARRPCAGPAAPDRHRRLKRRPRSHRPRGRGNSTGPAPRRSVRSRATCVRRAPGRPPRTDPRHRPPPAHRHRSVAAVRCCHGIVRPAIPRPCCHCRRAAAAMRPLSKPQMARSPAMIGRLVPRSDRRGTCWSITQFSLPSLAERPCSLPSTPRTTTTPLPIAGAERISAVDAHSPALRAVLLGQGDHIALGAADDDQAVRGTGTGRDRSAHGVLPELLAARQVIRRRRFPYSWPGTRAARRRRRPALTAAPAFRRPP